MIDEYNNINNILILFHKEIDKWGTQQYRNKGTYIQIAERVLKFWIDGGWGFKDLKF